MFPPLEPREAAYADLVEVIKRTLDDIYDNPVDASTKDLFSKFTRAVVRLRNRVVVITLNYDLLIDQLLRDTNEWFPVDGYGFELPFAGFAPSTSERLIAEARLQKGKRAEEPLSAMLLKMHGSLNWGTRNLSYPDGTSPIELEPLGALPSNDVPKLGTINYMSVLQRLRPTSYYWKTYIIPPLLTKLPGETQPLIENIWFQARGGIAFADAVHLLGYSMPPSDFEMEMLVREGLHSPLPHKPNRRVFIVNRDASTAERIKSLLEFGDVTVDISCSDVVEHLNAILPELTA